MIRITPSLLESFRLYLTEEWFTTEKMVEAITGDFVPTPQIRLGQAYHKMIEDHASVHEMYFKHGNPHEQEMLVSQDGYKFAYEPCIQPVRDFLEAGCQQEVYGTRILETAHGPVSIATKADAVWGNMGGEWKTTEKPIQIQKYMESVQWKLCAWALHLRSMDYRVIQLFEREDQVWDVKNYEAVQMIWSESLMKEVIWIINGLIDFHFSQGLSEYLKPYKERNLPAATHTEEQAEEWALLANMEGL